MSDADVAQIRAEFDVEERALLAALIGGLIPRDIVPNPDAAATVIQVSALEVALDTSGLRLRGRVDDRDDRHALVDMFHRYLFPVVPRARKAK